MQPFANAGLKNRITNIFVAKSFSNINFPFNVHQWRKRVGESFFEKLLQESLRIVFVSKALKTNQLKRIVVDTTVQPKTVAFPTDVGLMRKAITSLVDIAKKNTIDLRQTYERVLKRAAIKSGRYRHAKQMKRVKREEQYPLDGHTLSLWMVLCLMHS